MEAAAFCPAHVTGFFKAHLGGPAPATGSTGAGFSMGLGVTTRVSVSPRAGRDGTCRIVSPGYSGATDVSEFVVAEFLRMGFDCFVDVRHEAGVPVGYGLGASGAAALSLALALDSALGAGLGREGAGAIAHAAEVACSTGLGDVLASLHGGFEVRTRPGAPGVGAVESIPVDGVSVAVACLSPVSTSRFMREDLSRINGLGGRMVGRLLESRDYAHFQEMSLEFAGHAGVMTPRMRGIAGDLAAAGLGCGVALFGETVFAMVRRGDERRALGIMGRHGGILLSSGIDGAGARLLG